MAQQNTKTPAMVLQEFTVKHGYSPPEYILVLSKTGTHENEFHYQVDVANITGKGFGRSKQVAKHDAASKALEILAAEGLYDPSSNPAQEFNAQAHRNESDSPHKPPTNFIGTLQDQCCEFKLPFPTFVEISDVGPPHCRIFTYECKLASITTQATANTKKQAKQLAAKDMLDKIKDICPELSQTFQEISNALTESDKEAILRYSDFTLDVIRNKSITVDDFTFVFKKIMTEKELTFEDFKEMFKIKSKENFQSILEKLDVKYEVLELMAVPSIVSLIFGLESPFSIIGQGNDKETAESNAIKEALVVMEIYMEASNENIP